MQYILNLAARGTNYVDCYRFLFQMRLLHPLPTFDEPMEDGRNRHLMAGDTDKSTLPVKCE
jgi:hypothetical protein